MIQVNKTLFINPAHIVSYSESEEEPSAMINTLDGKRVFCGPVYWPLARVKLTPIADIEFETLAALRYLDTYKSQIRLTANDHALDISEGKTVSDALIALAQSLRENNITPQADGE